MIKLIKIPGDNKGYALTYVLFINLLIFSSVLALMGILFFYNFRSLKVVLKTKLDLACYSAVQILLADTTSASKPEITLICDSISVNIQQKQLGLFREIIASANTGKDSSAYECIIGCDLQLPFNNAVTITHPRTSVTIAGMTNINGNMELTSAGVTRGNIFGIRNSNDNYILGKVLVNENLQTKFFNDSLISNIFSDSYLKKESFTTLKTTILDNDFFNKNSLQHNYIIEGDLTLKDSLSIRSYNPYYFRVSGRTTFIKNCFSNLNITIYSDSIAQIENNCRIGNAIVISKTGIYCEGSSLKSTQLFSQDSILISNSYFSYPSVAANYVNTSDSAKLNSHITVVNSIFNGSIIQVNSIVGQINNKSKITIDKQSKIQGIIYSDNNVELLGTLLGSIYTYNFYYYKQPSEYINWLIDVNINRGKLDKWFLVPVGFKSKSRYEIINEKWLY
jgi:hypothetical protein